VQLSLFVVQTGDRRSRMLLDDETKRTVVDVLARLIAGVSSPMLQESDDVRRFELQDQTNAP
jgi:hypothetical protein